MQLQINTDCSLKVHESESEQLRGIKCVQTWTG